MNEQELRDRLAFLRAAERLKDTLRSGRTTSGRTESVAEHTWQLTLFTIVFADLLPDVDLLQLLKICILHDLGEAIGGDIPAPDQEASVLKSAQERQDSQQLITPLPLPLRRHFLDLWDDDDEAASPEGQLAKALDKLETILQHAQGEADGEFDFAFNLVDARRHTDAHPLTAALGSTGCRNDCQNRSPEREVTHSGTSDASSAPENFTQTA